MVKKKQEKSNTSIWFWFAYCLIIIALIFDLIYYHEFGTFGWWWNDDWHEINIAGLYWFAGIAILLIYLLSKFKNKL